MIHWEYIEVGKLNAILTEVILSALLEPAFPKENKKMAEGGSAVREAINQGFGKFPISFSIYIVVVKRDFIK